MWVLAWTSVFKSGICVSCKNREYDCLNVCYKVVVILCIPNSSEWGFLLLHIFANHWYYQYFELNYPNRCVVVSLCSLICNYLLVNNLSIFSYAYFLSLYLLWWNISSNISFYILPIFNWVAFLFLSLKSFCTFCTKILYHITSVSYKYFLPVLTCLFIFLLLTFEEQNLLILMNPVHYSFLSWIIFLFPI